MNRLVAPLFGAIVAMMPASALAQVRWDAELQGGVEGRFLTSKPEGASNADAGPVIGMSGHVAVVPLLRVGLYFDYEESTIADQAARQMFGGGLDVRVLSPWPLGDVKLYGRTGVGERFAFATPDRSPPLSGEQNVSMHGWFTEVPIGVGVAYRAAGRVWLTGELGARIGFGFSGGAYRAPAVTSGEPAGTEGADTLALYFELGVMWGG